MNIVIWVVAYIISTFVVTFHVTALQRADSLLSRIGTTRRWSVRMASTAYILILHWLEIIMFGGIYYILVKVINVGEIVGAMSVRDYFYFSATSYTSLGFGDLYPKGDIRIIAAIEALVGLIMIGWTIAFTFNYVTKNE